MQTPLLLPLASAAVFVLSVVRRHTYFIGLQKHEDTGRTVYSLNGDPGVVYRLFRLDAIVRDFFHLYPELRDKYMGLAQSTEAYTLDKSVIYLCFEEVDSFNTLVFVLLHEMAHMVGNDVGHGDAFKRRFTKLLKEAAAKGVYVPTDYRRMPTRYCHLTITASPL